MNQNPFFKLLKVVATIAAAALAYTALCIASPELAVGLFALAVITAPWWYGAVRRGGR
ncbi:hypothetical protein [Stenotrophomonas sp. G106K1]|uniref:hypothetical protein n=1 Tax=Stenotrophomonas sp. G106K1 TaxID=3134792 RepID=UPI0030F3F456